MGTIYKRGDVWWIGYQRGGKQHLESSGSESKEKAQSILRLREGDIEHGLPVTPANNRLKWDEAAADVVNDYKTNGKKSLADVKRRIEKHLTPYFGGRRMSSITTAEIRAYIAAVRVRQKRCGVQVSVDWQMGARKPRARPSVS